MNLPSPACVVRVGDGRGFICEYRISTEGLPRLRTARWRKFLVRRVIMTAAHCLRNLPPAHPFSNTEERTFPKLISTLDGSRKDIWVECLYADPVADIAVLGQPDGQVGLG